MALLLPPYTTGTATVANGGISITVTGILGPNNAREGDLFVHAATGLGVLIRDVPNTTHITIDPWPGAALSAAAYRIEKTSPLRYAWGTALADVQRMLDTLNGQTFYTVVGDAPDNQYGEEGQYALKSNGGGWKLWLKTGGGWVLQGAPAGLTYRGEWNSGTPYAVNDRVSLNGTSYMAKALNTNVNPSTDTAHTYWDAGGVKGDKGDTGNTGPKGDTGITGLRSTIAIGVVATGSAGSAASVSNSGTSTDATFNFSIPQGIQGAIGPPSVISASSTSVVTVGTGAKIFSIPAGLSIAFGQRYRATNIGRDRVMVGLVSSYVGTSLTIMVDFTQGVGADNTWTIALAGEVGQQGGSGPSGQTGAKGDKGDKGDIGAPSTVPGPKGDMGSGLAPNASGTFAQRAAYDGQSRGFQYLQTDVSPFLLWVKASNTSADWAGPNPIGSFAAVGDLGHATDSVISSFDYGHAA